MLPPLSVSSGQQGLSPLFCIRNAFVPFSSRFVKRTACWHALLRCSAASPSCGHLHRQKGCDHWGNTYTSRNPLRTSVCGFCTASSTASSSWVQRSTAFRRTPPHHNDCAANRTKRKGGVGGDEGGTWLHHQRAMYSTCFDEQEAPDCRPPPPAAPVVSSALEEESCASSHQSSEAGPTPDGDHGWNENRPKEEVSSTRSSAGATSSAPSTTAAQPKESAEEAVVWITGATSIAPPPPPLSPFGERVVPIPSLHALHAMCRPLLRIKKGTTAPSSSSSLEEETGEKGDTALDSHHHHAGLQEEDPAYLDELLSKLVVACDEAKNHLSWATRAAQHYKRSFHRGHRVLAGQAKAIQKVMKELEEGAEKDGANRNASGRPDIRKERLREVIAESQHRIGDRWFYWPEDLPDPKGNAGFEACHGSMAGSTSASSTSPADSTTATSQERRKKEECRKRWARPWATPVRLPL